jgi:broad specificity phosphatase PhoE
MITLYLLRHGDYANPRGIIPGRLPVELSQKGREQIKKLRKFFQDQQITKIYSSAVLRCKQTAEIISQGEIPIEFDKRLLETLSSFQGYWEKDWMQFFNMRSELGGESNKEVQARMVDFFHTTTLLDGNNYIVCSHGDPLYFLYQYFAGQPLLAEEVHEKNPVCPDDYLQKGDIRPIILDAHKNILEIQPIIRQERL